MAVSSLITAPRFPLWDLLQTSLCLFSLGCGIGYGYLHRVPTHSAGKEKTSFPARGVGAAAAPPKDGFAEVHLDSVVPTVPTALPSSAPTALLTPTAVICNVQTGSTPLLGGVSLAAHLANLNSSLPNAGQVLPPAVGGLQYAGSLPLPHLGGTSGAAPPGGPLPPPAYVPLSAAAPEKTLDSPAIQTNRTLTNAAAATSSVCGPVNIAMTADSW